MRRNIVVGAGFFACALAPSGSSGQALQEAPVFARAGYAIEVSGGFFIGNHTAVFSGLDVKPALSFSALALKRGFPGESFDIFAGFARTAFGCEEGYCAREDEEAPVITIAGTHGIAGVDYAPSRSFFLRLGAMAGTVDKAGGAEEAPSLGIGVLTQLGFVIAAGPVEIRPGLSYRWMQANSPTVQARALAIGWDMGLRYAFAF